MDYFFDKINYKYENKVLNPPKKEKKNHIPNHATHPLSAPNGQGRLDAFWGLRRNIEIGLKKFFK
jgi:hypothetical protein